MTRKQPIDKMKAIYFIGVLIFHFLLSACSELDPVKEDTPELISRVTLTFTPLNTSVPIVEVTATDPDGEGVKNIVADGPINLSQATTYALSIQLINGLAIPGTKGYDLTEEVAEEGDEHQFYFAWTNGVFSDPAGSGNCDSPQGVVNYTGGANSVDTNGLNLGLTTTWTTFVTTATGTFRVVLKHQPSLKTTTTGTDVGETDLDISFTMNVQ